MNINEMADKVMDYMDENEYRYNYIEDEKNPRIETGFSVKNKLASIKEVIVFSETGFGVYTYSPMKADEETRLAVAEYVTRANYGLLNGNFELDMRDGEVRYKMYTLVNDTDISAISKSVIEAAVELPLSMMNRYGNGLATIMMGFSDPETEINKAEGK